MGAWTADAFEVPVTIGGICIAPGDYMIADIDGAVIIPGRIAQEVVAEVESVMQTEDKVRSAIRGGMDPRKAYLQHGKF